MGNVSDPTVSLETWQVNPKMDVPTIGVMVWTNRVGDIRPMTGSAEHEAREQALRDGVVRPIKTAKLAL